MSKPKRHQASEKVLNVLICAASSLARAGLERLLDQHGVRVVAEVSNAGDLPAKIAESDPEVIILRLDAQPGEIRWKELMALGVPVVLLVEGVDSIRLSAAVANGVQAILAGDVTGAELAAAVASAAAGLLALSSDLADLVREDLLLHSAGEAENSTPDPAPIEGGSLEHLTLREREVLEMMSEGLSNKEIAAQLNISAHTVKFHISSILGKLGASSRTEATTIGLRRGLITI